MASSSFQSKHLMSDEEILALGVSEHLVEMFRRVKYTEAFGLSSWYHSLEGHTMRSVFLPLTWEHARAMMDVHLKKKLERFPPVLSELRERADAAIREFGRAFVKLSTRSPKDVFLYDFENERVQRLVLEELRERRASTSSEMCAAFVVATQRAMEVRSGEEAMRMLLASSRIYQDMSKQVQFPTHLFKSSLVVRDWIDTVPRQPEGEFRAWVVNNELTACTQYYSFLYFPLVARRKLEIRQILLDFFHSHVREQLAHRETYGIDFFVDFAAGDRVLVVELNTFGTQAGAGLFSWKEDREQMLGTTQQPFELRVVEQEPTAEQEAMQLVPRKWRQWIEANYSPPSGGSCATW